jgi:hypothetical protein
MPETTRELFTAQEELVLCLVLCFENMGLCARLAELNQQHLKAAANARRRTPLHRKNRAFNGARGS